MEKVKIVRREFEFLLDANDDNRAVMATYRHPPVPTFYKTGTEGKYYIFVFSPYSRFTGVPDHAGPFDTRAEARKGANRIISEIQRGGRYKFGGTEVAEAYFFKVVDEQRSKLIVCQQPTCTHFFLGHIHAGKWALVSGETSMDVMAGPFNARGLAMAAAKEIMREKNLELVKCTSKG